MNCKTKNAVYIITCKGCNEQDVRMNNDSLNARFEFAIKLADSKSYGLMKEEMFIQFKSSLNGLTL